MDVTAFEASVARDDEPPGLPPALEALWVLALGEPNAREAWDVAHAIVADDSGFDAAWVHAHLHRAEGDVPNALYWYARAGRPACTEPPDPPSLRAEWRAIAAALLASDSEGTAS